MFIGQFSHQLDEKNRIIVPAKFRDILNDQAIIAIGYDGCLTIYHQDDYYQTLMKLRDKEAKAEIRMLSSFADQCRFDKSGRTIIPAFLLKNLADLEKGRELIITGAADHIEIWTRHRWDEYCLKAKSLLEQ